MCWWAVHCASLQAGGRVWGPVGCGRGWRSCDRSLGPEPLTGTLGLACECAGDLPAQRRRECILNKGVRGYSSVSERHPEESLASPRSSFW